MKKIPSLGEQEMDVLKFIDLNSPIAVREVALYFEKEKGLARTTVLTVMERLRKKGFLSRSKIENVFQYSAKIETRDLLTSKISDFVEKTLGGSITPLMNYFVSSSKLKPEELEKLKELVESLNKTKGKNS